MLLQTWVGVLYRLFSFPIVFVGFFAFFSGQRPTGWVVFNVALWPAVSLASIAFHEAGHALAGRMLGLFPRVIQLGVSREIARARVGAMEIRLHALPMMGLTWLAARGSAWLRLRLWLTIAAGPLATLVLLVGLIFLQPLASASSNILREPALWSFAIFTNAAMLVTNLFPARLAGGFRTDGLSLLRLPFTKQEELVELLTLDLLHDMQAALDRGDFDSARRLVGQILEQQPRAFGARVARASIELQAGDFVRAREQLAELRAEPPPNEAARFVVANNLAWAHFLSEDEAFREEADALSAESLGHFKSAGFALGTRGAVLTWLGRAEEARPLLEQAHVLNTTAVNRALNACCLALACVHLGERQRARAWVEEAKRSDASCILLPRALAAVSADPVAVAG